MVELGYLFLSLFMMAYGFWSYWRSREKNLLYLTIGLVFLFLSVLSQTLSTEWWFYVAQPTVSFRHLELIALGFFACFVIASIMALKEIGQPKSEARQPAAG